jgi:membrane fusion protein, copper/silver efflux system
MNRSPAVALFWLLGAVLALSTACKSEQARSPGTNSDQDHPPAPATAAAAKPVHDHGQGDTVALPPGYAPVEVDEGRQQLLGIKTLKVTRQPMDRGIRTVGLVSSDETRTAHVHVKYEGFIEELFVNYTGRAVKKGQPLFKIFSRELLAAQQEYLASRGALAGAGASGQPAREAADQLIAASRERLRLFDVPPQVIAKLDRTGVAERAITVVSPLTGTVLEKQALQGLAITPMVHLFVIADLARVWVVADIYERDLAAVKVGQEATLRLEALPGRLFTGKVTFLSPVVDSSTRTVKVRFEFANSDGALRPGMYATVQIDAGQGESLVIPADSLIDTGLRKVVFVATANGRFEPRAIVTGAATGGQYEVAEGLREGEVIAASGQFLLDSESRIRGARTGGAPPAHGGH